MSFILQQEINSFKRMRFIFYMQGYLKTIVTYSSLNFIEVRYTDEFNTFDSFSVKSHDDCHFNRGLLHFVLHLYCNISKFIRKIILYLNIIKFKNVVFICMQDFSCQIWIKYNVISTNEHLSVC